MTARPGPIASVDKAMRVIERLAEPGTTSLTLTDLAAEVGLNKSSLHHTLSTLRARGWVEQDEEGRYALGHTSAVIARWWSSTDRVTQVLRPTLERICSASHETVHLGRLRGRNVIYCDKVEPDRPVRVVSQVGRTVPAVTTSLGRAVLGASDPVALGVRDWLEEVASSSDERHGSPSHRGGSTSVVSPPTDLATRLEEELQRVRRCGYATEIQENEAGIACVGVPLLVNEQPGWAVSVTMPAERCDRERLRSLAKVIVSAVTDLGASHVHTFQPVS